MTASKFCAKCGSPLIPGDRFCSNCGAEVASISAIRGLQRSKHETHRRPAPTLAPMEIVPTKHIETKEISAEVELKPPKPFDVLSGKARVAKTTRTESEAA